MEEKDFLKTNVKLHPDLVKRVLVDKISARQCFLDVIKEICPTFQVDDDNREILSQICYWCFRIKQPQAALDPSKGLWLYGYVGSGKSLMMECVLSFIGKYWVSINYPYENEKLNPTSIGIVELCLKFAKDGQATLERIPVGLDEIGTEPRLSQYMGNHLNIFGYVIETLSKQTLSIPRIVTTNLTFEEVLSKYGPRVIDRIGLLFNPIFFKGDSHRPSKEIWDMIQKERESKS